MVAFTYKPFISSGLSNNINASIMPNGAAGWLAVIGHHSAMALTVDVGQRGVWPNMGSGRTLVYVVTKNA